MIDELAAYGLTGDEPPLEFIGGWCVMRRDYLKGTVILAKLEEGAGPNGTDKWDWKEEQDCTILCEDNAILRSELDGRRYGDGMQLVARIPMNLWAGELMDPIRQKDRGAVKRWLNDPDHAAFRVKSGRV